ncbi:putative membrane protein YccC [Rhizomicrobium palustre]|uniref:Putative membrane protein YccC n=1 Tax=Rhizomicrobium palustre TaxID=189966 RepID=A0A846N452_9PROT|nr:FUSC family membrane protein [Rhizomicrobium palustre]NIK90245.1 putative membrane protein YccC [Rhizomicrobium palustre]
MSGLRLIPPHLLAVPRRLGLALFRLHIENGAFVSLGMGIVGGLFALAYGQTVAILAASGALCASVVDKPGPAPVKLRMYALAVSGATFVALFAMLFEHHHIWMGILVAAMSFVSSLASAYGRRAIGLSVAAVLALLFGMAANRASLMPISDYIGIFFAGGVSYALISIGLSALFDIRNRRMFLGEAVHAFSSYLEAKATLYDPACDARLALEKLVEAHAAFTEKLQAARDFVFLGRRTASRQRWMAALLALLDCFDSVVSSDADIETMRQSGHNDLLLRLKALTARFAADTEELALALTTPGAHFSFNPHTAEILELQAEVEQLAATAWGRESLAISAFRSAGHKLALGIARMERLAQATDTSADANTILPKVELEAFVHRDRMDPRVLQSLFSLSSPVMRYAIRVTGAMTAGYMLTLLLPNMMHGGWVLLTTSLIMRASYSITRQRRNDRIIGTAAGSIIAAVLVHYISRDFLFLPVIFSVGAAHAFADVAFKVTATCASITALLQLHFLGPDVEPSSVLVLERLGDTMIGAALSWVFSFVLPSWEWKNVPNLVRAVVDADKSYAALALSRRRNDQDFRLARKRAHDAAANLTMTVRRLADEPRIDKTKLAALHDLVAANYLMASDLASMRVLFRTRKQELNPDDAERVLDLARQNVEQALNPAEAKDKGPTRLSRRSLGESIGGHNAMVSLTRRLIHIERMAGRVSALAAKVLKA